MKKMITVSTLILIATVITTSAYAWYDCPRITRTGVASSENPADRQAFYDTTTALRAALAADRAELNALMAGTNPDPQRARALSESISEQQNELRQQAEKHNVSMGRMGNGTCDVSGQGRQSRGRMMD